MKKKVFIAIPTYSQKVHVFCMMSLLGSLPKLAERGWDWHLHAQVGDALLPRCRSMLVEAFLASDCTDLFWIDDDLAWKAEDFIKLLDHDVDLVAGVYRLKTSEEKFPVNWLDGPEENGLTPAATVPFGFVKTTRKLYETMAARLPLRQWEDEGKQFREFFIFDVHSGMYWGEDFNFCNWWREIGGKVWVDKSIELVHYGLHPFKGGPAAELQKQAEVRTLFSKALALEAAA